MSLPEAARRSGAQSRSGRWRDPSLGALPAAAASQPSRLSRPQCSRPGTGHHTVARAPPAPGCGENHGVMQKHPRTVSTADPSSPLRFYSWVSVFKLKSFSPPRHGRPARIQLGTSRGSSCRRAQEHERIASDLLTKLPRGCCGAGTHGRLPGLRAPRLGKSTPGARTPASTSEGQKSFQKEKEEFPKRTPIHRRGTPPGTTEEQYFGGKQCRC